MNTQENQFLFKEKIIEGKGELQAKKEIERLEISQKDFKKLWYENKSLKKEIESLNKQLANKKGDNFKKSFASLTQPTRVYEGDFKHLGRLLNHMERGRKYLRKELAQELCMNGEDLNACLYFLNDHKLANIEFLREGGLLMK